MTCSAELDKRQLTTLATIFELGTESPFPKSDCHWPSKCSVSESDTTSWSWGLDVSPKIGKSLKLGVSGGFSSPTSTAHGRSWEIEPGTGQCGCFTFVPLRKTTW